MSDHACPHCQYSPVPPGSRFCPNCGEEQPQESPKAQITVNQQIGTLQEGTATGVHIEHLVGSVNLTQVDENQARRRRNLLILLRKVRDFWVSGVLERSVQDSDLQVHIQGETCSIP